MEGDQDGQTPGPWWLPVGSQGSAPSRMGWLDTSPPCASLTQASVSLLL